MELTLEQFEVATGATRQNALIYYEHAVAACLRFDIVTPPRMAAFFGSMSVETQRLTHMEEDLYYRDAERLAKLFRRVFDLNKDGAIEADEIDKARPYCRMPKELSYKLYGGYHGRGGMMLTWEKNYKHQGTKLGFPYAHEPELVMQPSHAMLTAASFWDDAACNEAAEDMDEVTRRINGPARLHLAERIAQRNRALEVWA